MVDASKEIVLSWQTQRFAGSRAKEWPAWSLNEQGLCYGVVESPEISRWIVPRRTRSGARSAAGVGECELARQQDG